MYGVRVANGKLVANLSKLAKTDTKMPYSLPLLQAIGYHMVAKINIVNYYIGRENFFKVNTRLIRNDMPFKNLLVHYVVNSILMSMRLLPITPRSNIHFIRSDSYSRKALGSSHVFTDVVIKKDSIEIHEYSPDLREAYIYSNYATTTDFLRALIKQRLEWHLTFQVKSSAVRKLNAQSDYETFAAAAQQLNEDKKRIREANVQRLEKKLEGLFVKIASLIIGF